VALIR